VVKVTQARMAEAASEDAAGLPVQTEAHISQVSR
jgi:polysaccharide export outer membrane protein